MLCWVHGLKEFLRSSLKMIPGSAHGCAGSFFHPADGPNNQVTVLYQEVDCCSWHKILLESGILNLLKCKDKMSPESPAVWGTVPKSFSVPFPSKYLRAVTDRSGVLEQAEPHTCVQGLLWNVRSVWCSFLLGWQVQLKVIHILIISCVFLSSGFNCPQLKVINLRENTEEQQQNSGGKGEVLGVGWWLLDLPGTSQPGPSLAFILQLRQRNFNTAERSVKNQKAVFSFSLQNKTLHSGR